MLSVSDTGVGMDEKTQSRLFEPFFTTKELGKGTGLGLAMVYGTTKQSNGHIAVESKAGHGTTFRIYLPRTEAAKSAPLEARREASTRGSETVLLAEDDSNLRILAREILASRATRCSIQGTSRDACASRNYGGAIHLLLRRRDAADERARLADAVSAEAGLKVLYMSGYTDDAIVNAGCSIPGRPSPQAIARQPGPQGARGPRWIAIAAAAGVGTPVSSSS
jgi:hypothetical protein